MIKFKINVLAALQKHGITFYSCRGNNGQFAQGTLTRIKKGKSVNFDTINKLCAVLDLQPGDLLEYIPDSDKE